MKTWKCKIGLHKWSGWEEAGLPIWGTDFMGFNCYQMLYQRTCKCCGKIVKEWSEG